MKLRYDIPQDKAFGTVYADPPWMLKMGGGMRKLKYDTMSTTEIGEAGITLHKEGVLDKHALCWLWTTNPHLPEALRVLDFWGFEYKTMVTWNKERLGLGWWLRSRTEHVLLGARPGTKPGRMGRPGAWSTLLEGGYRGHSVKPLEMYSLIEARSPGPYLELFANRLAPRAGWTQLASPKQPTGDRYGTGYTPPQCPRCPHPAHGKSQLVNDWKACGVAVSNDEQNAAWNCPCEGE